MQQVTQRSSKPSIPPISDAELARRIGEGDQDAFTTLMRRHNRVLYRTARSILKDDAEAEDALQEAYLLAYRHIDQFRGDARLSTWLVRIVVNEAIGRCRKSQRRAQVIGLNGECEPDDDSLEEIMDGAPPEQPERAAMRAQMRSLLEKKIDELPEAFRTVFMLRALEEMTVEEVADCLSIPEATVRTRFFRARGMLREALSKEMDFAFEDAFAFDGQRCDNIVARVLQRIAGQAGGKD